MNDLMLSKEFNGFWRRQFGEDYTPETMDSGMIIQQIAAKYQPDTVDPWVVNRWAEIEREQQQQRLGSMFDALAYGHSPKKRPSFAFPFVQPLFSPAIIPA